MDFRGFLREYIEQQARPVYKIGHQPRLYALTQSIGQDLLFDDDAVFAAVYLHDLGVFVGHRPEDPHLLTEWDHVAYTTAKAPSILRQAGFPEHKIEAVLQIIREHQPDDEPSSIESEIVRDADILEQLGAVGCLRTAAKLGSDTRFATFADVNQSLKRALSTLPSRLRLPVARRLAEPKIAALRNFLLSLEVESIPDMY
jgi:uncharacterized protein